MQLQVKTLLKKVFFFIVSVSFATACFSQTAEDSLLELGNSFFRKQDFVKAASTWEKAAAAEYRISKGADYSYAAIAFAYGKDSSNSFRCLEMAITKYGFNDIPNLIAQDSFAFMKKSQHWSKLIGSIKPTYSTDPLKSRVVDTDVRHFWQAYDLVQKDTAKAVKIYKEQYISKGTLALQDYFLNKISTVENFVYIHQLYSKFYRSIRGNSLKAASFKQLYQNSFVNLKKIYPEAIFPDIFFVMGKFNSAGTVSSNGIIIGIDMRCYSPTVDTTELGIWNKRNLTNLAGLPYTVAHELVHFEQTGMASDTTLLKGAILEGMADFIGELISGKTTNERLKVYAKGKEKQIWNDFKKEMFLNRAHNWIANSEQETADKPADLGYWVGYSICKAYYDRAKDKKKAIYDMLHIQDYKKFLKDSQLDEQWK